MAAIGVPATGAIVASWDLPSSLAWAQEVLPAQTPIFRSAVSLVRVDTIVTDEDGNFVDGLTAADFRVFEEGC